MRGQVRIHTGTQCSYYETRADGTHYQVGRAQDRGDRCYANRPKGWYWHDLDDQWGIVEESVTGPFSTEADVHAAGRLRAPPSV